MGNVFYFLRRNNFFFSYMYGLNEDYFKIWKFIFYVFYIKKNIFKEVIYKIR